MDSKIPEIRVFQSAVGFTDPGGGAAGPSRSQAARRGGACGTHRRLWRLRRGWFHLTSIPGGVDAPAAQTPRDSSAGTAGHTSVDVARFVGVNERTVRRVAREAPVTQLEAIVSPQRVGRPAPPSRTVS